MYIYPHIYECRRNKHVSFDKIETAVLNEVSKALSSDDFALTCAMPEEGRLEKLRADLTKAQQDVTRTINECNFVVSDMRRGIIPTEVYETRMKELKSLLGYQKGVAVKGVARRGVSPLKRM